MSAEPLLAVDGLTVVYERDGHAPRAVEDVSFAIPRGKVVALLGESGCGKTTIALSLLRLLRKPGRIASGSVTYRGRDLLRMSEGELRALRGSAISVVFQDPLLALHPAMRVGAQVAEALRVHLELGQAEAWRRAVELLRDAGIADAENRASAFPHELSGGLRQRVLLAAALACEPELLVADEPTSALDATLQAEVLSRLSRLRRERSLSMLLITHDLGVAARMADEVLVMAGGRIVERGPADAVLSHPRHPRTMEMIAAARALRERSSPSECGDAPALELRRLCKRFVRRDPRGETRAINAVDDVSLCVGEAETVGLVGESGSGKSTLARLALRLIEPDSGRVELGGVDLASLPAAKLRPLRRHLQLVFSDPHASLDPRQRIGAAIGEAIEVHRLAGRLEREERVARLLADVGLPPRFGERRPHQLSGGQRQRAAIARALASSARVLVADEPLAALDATVQAQIVDLLRELQVTKRLACLFISHDLALVRRIANRVAVMYLGRIVELSPAGVLYDEPLHPYTRALLAAMLPLTRHEEPDEHAPSILETVAPNDRGCPFEPRCPVRNKPRACLAERPPLREVRPGRFAACHVA